MRRSERSRSRSSSRALTFSVASVCLLLVQTAGAQQPAAEPPPPVEQPPAPSEPAPAPPPAPSPMPPPPPNYPPPPPYGPPPSYGYQQNYYPAAQPLRAPYRPFTLGLGLGVGML